MSEADLALRARQGDTAAWETLAGEYQEASFRLAYLMLGDADDARDVAQETFIRAFRALNRFDTERPLRPWLLSITANLARNRRRGLSRYLAAVSRFAQAAPHPTSQAGEERAHLLDKQSVWQAIRRLNPNDQQVIYLRYFLDLSETETATTLDIAQGTVKSRLHRAIGRLRTVVKQEFPDLREEFEA